MQPILLRSLRSPFLTLGLTVGRATSDLIDDQEVLIRSRETAHLRREALLLPCGVAKRIVRVDSSHYSVCACACNLQHSPRRHRGNPDQGEFYPRLIARPVSSWSHWQGADFCVFFADRESSYLKGDEQHGCHSGRERHVDSIRVGRGTDRRTNVRKGPLASPHSRCATAFDIRHSTSAHPHCHLLRRLDIFERQGHRLAIRGTSKGQVRQPELCLGRGKRR